MHYCFSAMYLCFAYSLFYSFSGTGSVAEPYTHMVRLKQNSSLVNQKEKVLADDSHKERYNESNKTKHNVLEKNIHLQKCNQQKKTLTKHHENGVIFYIPSLSHDDEIFGSSKNISEQFKFKENENYKNSSRKLLHKLEQMSVKHLTNSEIYHSIEKREAIGNWKINSESNYSIVFINHTKHIKYLPGANKSVEYLKHTTEISVRHDKDVENSNVTHTGYKSMKYCKQYKKYALEKTYASPLLPVLIPFVVGEQRRCRILPLIVGGIKASRGEFPHMAALGYNTGRQTHFLCGASLISDRYVLTAAHCAKTKWGFPVVVRFSILNVLTEIGQTVTVDDVVIHPNYKEPSVYNDIALVKFADQLRLGHNLRPACLPEINTESNNPGSIVTAVGWGKTGYNLFSSPDLLKVKLKVVSLSKCEETFVSKERSIRLQRGISENMICASGYLDPLHDTCQGDSGGPLQITYADDESGYCMHEIIGITSFGKQCGTGMPAVYTRVSAYIGWIESIVWPL